jgi:hypothetical protein
MMKLMKCGMVVLLAAVISFSGLNVLEAKDKDEPASYILMFQAQEYDAKIKDAVSYFFTKVLKPQDSVLLFSPMRPYNFSKETREKVPLNKLVARTQNVLKKDIAMNAGNFRSVENGMEQVVRQLAEFMGTRPGRNDEMTASSGSGTEIKNLLTQYHQLLESYRGQRKINDGLFVKLSQMYKNVKSKKHMVVFYDKTFRIVPDKDTMDALRANQEFSFMASEAFVTENTSKIMDTDKVIMDLKDAGVNFSLIYVTKQKRRRPGYEFSELSGDVYNALSKVANETGGIVMATNKPEAALKKAVEN